MARKAREGGLAVANASERNTAGGPQNRALREPRTRPRTVLPCLARAGPLPAQGAVS